uniref:Uncharacterized protein n=1 Tax=Oryza nivara TaxID=4536 RepID=A0A0E0J083_ORYNI
MSIPPSSTGRVSLGIHWYNTSHLKKFRIVLEVYKYLFGASSIGQCFSLPLSYPDGFTSWQTQGKGELTEL